MRGAAPTALADAHEVWDRGDYPAALKAYIQIVSGPQGDGALEEIALQTVPAQNPRPRACAWFLPKDRSRRIVVPQRQGRRWRHHSLSGLAAGSIVAVKAVNSRGLEGWDWARARVP